MGRSQESDLMAKVRPVGEGEVRDEGGRRRRRRGPQEGQLRLAQTAGALGGLCVKILLLLSPASAAGHFTMLRI